MVESRTKGRPPEQPPSFQFVTTNVSQATLYLSQWESGGCDITHFMVQYRRVGANRWITGMSLYLLEISEQLDYISTI